MTETPHPFGSTRQFEVKNYLLTQIKDLKLTPKIQDFETQVPNKKRTSLLSPLTEIKQGYNVYASLDLVENPRCIVALASHYDTKDIEGISYVGANDSGSSSALLLDLGRHLLKLKKEFKFTCDVFLVWFDGEESVLPNWNDGLKYELKLTDNTYGSRYFAKAVGECGENKNSGLLFSGLILLDMVGYKDLQITLDKHSNTKLSKLLIEASSFIGHKHVIKTNYSMAIEDDHIPFQKKGVSVLNIIDFNHPHHWHTDLDLYETVSSNSLEISGKLALYVLLHLAKTPDTYSETPTPCLKNIGSPLT